MTSPLRIHGPLEHTHAGWSAAAVAIGRPAVELASRGPESMPVTMSNHSHAENWFELLTRPLWGMASAPETVPEPMWTAAAETLARALDPGDPWYVGAVTDAGQRCVEAAAVGWGLALAPERLWDPLPPKAKDNVSAWLRSAYAADVADCNWHYFPVFAGHGLERVGIEHDKSISRAHLERMGEWLLGDSVFEDGPGGRVDYYNPFAFHTYALLHYRLSGDDRYVGPASAFARRFRSWFAADGPAVPYGRSLGYRFAQASLWGALAAADVEAVPWGEAAGFARRHLEWWWDKPILDPEGRLTVGYGYPNDALVEQYLTAGSPWWASKVFVGLTAGADHPFWTERATEPEAVVEPHKAARAVHVRDRGGNVTRLNGQGWRAWARGGQEIYAKFAYSTLAAFSHSVAGPGLECAVPDGALMLSEDGRHWRGREDSEEGDIDDKGVLTVTWQPWEDVSITTSLEAAVDGWHARIHIVETERTLHTGEGGWCVPLEGHAADVADHRASVTGTGLRSEIIDGDSGREAGLISPMPGTHLYWPSTVLPVLRGMLEPGRHVMKSLIYIGRELFGRGPIGGRMSQPGRPGTLGSVTLESPTEEDPVESDATEQSAIEVFTEHRELLFAIVYNMLGTVADTEDVLQETWLSWEPRWRAGRIEHPRAYLVRVAVNAATSRRKAVSRRRETYIGPWLPEPFPTPPGATEPDASEGALLTESVSMALQVVLESLTPAERAVFVLREVFAYGHDEIAEMVERSPAAVRQLAHRARSHVHARRPRHRVDPRVHREVTERFMNAVRDGDLDGLLALLAPEATLICDGGGRAPAAGPRPMHGAGKVADFLLRRTFRLGLGRVEYRTVNGEPAALLVRDGTAVSVMVLDPTGEGDRVTGVYAVTNPAKLANLR
ncbi:sigma-70 family RNA polymerase sigma factor [Glycomyces xiaoerkulensis]|uniref:sigma-70 family RNA polymerase sigma factor n=1 Tax=Glycomyces xiaoerkulensis TaxID=2038139 RepID=UPI0018E4D741|nr:sigma-70 family RNA polymerase sigma factor [Glycomyces xiaoerkulensis]